MLVVLAYLIRKYSLHLVGSFILSCTAAIFDFLLVTTLISKSLSINETYQLILFLALSIILKISSSIINLNLIREISITETKIILQNLSLGLKRIDSQTRASNETMLAYKFTEVAGSLISILEGLKSVLILIGITVAAIYNFSDQLTIHYVAYVFIGLFSIILIAVILVRYLIYLGAKSNHWLNELSKSLKFIYTNQIEILLQKGQYIIGGVLRAQRMLRLYQFIIQAFSQNFRGFFEISGLLIFTICVFFGYASHVGLIVGLAALQRFMPNIQSIFHSFFSLGVAKSVLLEFAELKNYNLSKEPLVPVSLSDVTEFSYTSSRPIGKINLNVNQKFIKGKIKLVSGPSGSGKSTYLTGLTGAFGPNGKVYVNQKCYTSYIIDSVEYFDNDSQIYGDTYKDYFGVSDSKKLRELFLDLLMPVDIIDRMLKVQLNFSETCETLSAGEYQRVKLIKVLLSNKDLLILDEPFSALDEITSGKAEKLVQNYTKNCFCLLVDHGAQDENH